MLCTHVTVPSIIHFCPAERRSTMRRSIIHRNTRKCQGLKSTPYIGDGHPTFNRESLFRGYINPDEIPFCMGNTVNLDPIAHINPQKPLLSPIRTIPTCFERFTTQGRPDSNFTAPEEPWNLRKQIHGWQATNVFREHKQKTVGFPIVPSYPVGSMYGPVYLIYIYIYLDWP